MSVMPMEFVTAPAAAPAKYGILSAAVVVEDSDPHVGFGYEYQPDFCGPARMTAALCQPDAAKVAEDGRDLVSGEPFAVYSMASCKAIGIGDAKGRASRALTTGEGRAVEEWLGTRLSADADDLGDADDVVLGLAGLEHYIHCNYGGQGTIHMDRAAASWLLAERALVTSGDRLTTNLGNVVSAGCYDPQPTPPGGNKPWTGTMWATGPVMLRRGPVFTVPDPVVDTSTNDVFALAERPYAGSWECFAVGIGVTAPA